LTPNIADAASVVTTDCTLSRQKHDLSLWKRKIFYRRCEA
jgi:hypothetical protein